MRGKVRDTITIGIIAPSSKVPQVELQIGVKAIREWGFKVRVHPICKKSHLFYAGTDEERATAFLEYATDPSVDVLWAARGGSGAIRILRHLDDWVAKNGVPAKKLFVGYSDSTALMEYVRQNWGWSILHGPMPSMRTFSLLSESDKSALSTWIGHGSVDRREAPWKRRLEFWANRPASPLEGTLLGGNLTVWNGLLGTPYQPKLDSSKSDRAILFFEDVDESLYRIDRMLQQQVLSGALDRKHVQAIVLGNFLNCRDQVPSVLRAGVKNLRAPKPRELQPLRKVLNEKTTLRKIWSDVGARLGIPVAFGLPVGHGPEVSPLPLGARYTLHPDGKFELVEWEWIKWGVV